MKKWNWRIYSLIAMVFLATTAWMMQADAAGTVTIFIDQKSLNVEDTLKVTVQTSEPEDDAIPPEVTLTYDNSLLEFTYCSEEYGGGEGGLITLHSTTANITFVAKKAGTASLSAEAIIDEDGNNKATSSRSVSISGTATSESSENVSEEESETEEESPDSKQDGDAEDETENSDERNVLSSDASLKRFKVSNAKLSPKFSADVTDYTVTLSDDVKQLLFTAKTKDKNAQILASSGFSNLKNGSNKAVLNVVAEDGTRKTYTFTIVKEGNAKSVDDISQREVASDVNGYIEIDSSELCVNTTFPEELVPEGFSKIDYVYKEQIVEAAYSEMGEMVLLYLSDSDGSMGDFYIYYSGSDEFMDFIQLKGAEGHFIFPIQFPVGVVIPDGFMDSALQWNDKTVPAFMVSQYMNDADDNMETETETEASGTEGNTDEAVTEETDQEGQFVQPEDFYLVYAMNQDGVQGFYLYDSLESTYQRYLDLAAEESDTGAFDEESYVIYKEKSQNRMVIIGVLIVAVVILGFILLNMFLKIRELESEFEEEDQDGEKDKEHVNDKTKEDIPQPKEKQAVKAEKRPNKLADRIKERKKAQEKRQEKKQEKKQENVAEKKQKQEPENVKVKQRADVPVVERKRESNRTSSQGRRPGPVMFDLSTPKVDGSLTPKMQREQLDDDFEFEFINIDE